MSPTQSQGFQHLRDLVAEGLASGEARALTPDRKALLLKAALEALDDVAAGRVYEEDEIEAALVMPWQRAKA